MGRHAPEVGNGEGVSGSLEQTGRKVSSCWEDGGSVVEVKVGKSATPEEGSWHTPEGETRRRPYIS